MRAKVRMQTTGLPTNQELSCKLFQSAGSPARCQQPVRDAALSAEPGVRKVFRALPFGPRCPMLVRRTGRDLVIHCATAAPSAANAGNEELMYAVNVRGTEHVVAACRAAGVPRLVYTSSASVVFEGKDLVGVNEDQPYASRPLDFYTRTKARSPPALVAAEGLRQLGAAPYLFTWGLLPDRVCMWQSKQYMVVEAFITGNG